MLCQPYLAWTLFLKSWGLMMTLNVRQDWDCFTCWIKLTRASPAVFLSLWYLWVDDDGDGDDDDDDGGGGGGDDDDDDDDKHYFILALFSTVLDYSRWGVTRGVFDSITKGSLVRKLPSYRRMSRGSLFITSSCDHHLNSIVSKSSSRVGGVEKSNSSGTREFTGENRVKTLWGNVAPGVVEVGCLFPLLRASIATKKCTSL